MPNEEVKIAQVDTNAEAISKLQKEAY